MSDIREREVSLTFKRDEARRFVSHTEVVAAATFALSPDHDYTTEHHPYGGYLMKVNHRDRPREILGYYKGIKH